MSDTQIESSRTTADPAYRGGYGATPSPGGGDRYRLYVEVEIDSVDEPSMTSLLDMARQLADGLAGSDAYPDLTDATQEGHAVYFVAHGVDRLRAQPESCEEATDNA